MGACGAEETLGAFRTLAGVFALCTFALGDAATVGFFVVAIVKD
jgi:hypothetical protein